MPDFHTRRPRGPNEPDGLAVRSNASKLRSLSIANRLGNLLIGGVVPSFAIVAVYVAPPLYPSNEQASGGHEEETTGGDRQRAANELACGTDFLSKTGNCHPPPRPARTQRYARPKATVKATGTCKPSRTAGRHPESSALFTQPRRRLVLRSPFAGSRILWALGVP